jgi:RNA polymerase nonessential primary-like sigma factor
MSSRIITNPEVVHSQAFSEDKPVALAGIEEGHDEPSNIDRKSVPVDSIRAYLKDIGRIPMLSREEELTESRKVQRYLQLLEMPGDQPTNPEHDRIIQDGLRAKTHMIQANLRLVVAVAKKYRNRGLDLMDLIQEGSLGLERGVEKFDPTKGYRFSTYAHWWIRQGITRAIANQARAIRLPIHITEKLNALKKVSRQLSQEKGRTATVAELAAAVDSSPEEIRKLLGQTRQPLSLDIKVGQEQETELGELIESEARSPEDQTTRTMLQDALDNMLAALTARERMVIEMRFGLIDSQSKSLAEIGQVLNVSRERARQLEAKALRKLRKPEARESVQGFLEGLG